MFERYTEKARRAVFFARYEASQFGSPYIETEHLLLGLLREDRDLRKLLGPDKSLEWVRKQIEAHTPVRAKTSTSIDLPLSNQCKRVLAYATGEADRHGHKFVDQGHLFVGLLTEEQCFAARLLRDRGVNFSAVREQRRQAPSTDAHNQPTGTPTEPPKPARISEPRWPAFIAMGADALIHFALPDRFSFGPRWLLFAVILALLIPIVVSSRIDRADIGRKLTFVAVGLLTLALIGSLSALITGLPNHKDPARTLLLSAFLLWITNILVFALWYWKLDAGGPLGREEGRAKPSFLFPPRMLPAAERDPMWSPNFLDYLFLAFNTSTAFSPTDTAVLARWAKVMTMLQSLVSLTIVVLLAARAVNVL